MDQAHISATGPFPGGPSTVPQLLPQNPPRARAPTEAMEEIRYGAMGARAGNGVNRA
jgi:hypothetical protein